MAGTVLKARSLVDALRDALQRAILTGEFAPGDSLTEEAVAQQYEIARPTAKAAIEQLVRAGLLRRTLNKTARVPLLDADDIRDLYWTRSIVERSAAIALAERRIDLTGVSRSIDRLRQAEGVMEVVDSDIEFHRILVSRLDSMRMTRLHDAVIGEAHLGMAQVQVHHLLHQDVIADEHAAILEAILDGDVDTSGDLSVRHLTEARDRLVTHLESQASAAGGEEPASPTPE
ncbi:MAG: GntR family transcriptional regulator [Nocardioides sp.]